MGGMMEADRVLSCDDLVAGLAQTEDLLDALFALLLNNASNPSERIVFFALQDTLERAANEGKEGEDGYLPIHLPSIAAAAGLSEKQVGAYIKSFERRGLVE